MIHFRYNKLMEKGEVATGQQLEEMESFLSSVPSSVKYSNNYTQPPISEEEQKRLEDQLQLLNKRKDHLRYSTVVSVKNGLMILK